MDIAKCTNDGIYYNAVDFSQLHPDELARKRRFLQCPECGGPAFFRHASSIGRTTCFGARPHAKGCNLIAYDYQRALYCAADDQDALLMPSGKIVVDFGYGSPDQPESVTGFGRGHSPGCDNHFFGEGYRPEALTHRRPSSLLRTLIESAAFSDSNKVIEVDGLGGIAVKDFFVPLLSITTQHLGKFKGFWGLLSDVRLSANKSTIWFNSGGLDTISFCLSSKYLDEFNQRYRVRDTEDLAGAYILVFGMLKVSHDGKLYCLIEEPDLMALRLT